MSNEEKSLNLLIEAYKLYSAFCAIIIVGLLTFSSALTDINNILSLYIAIGSLFLCSLFCILGIQFFISKVHKGRFDVYNKDARFSRFCMSMTLVLLTVGMISGFYFFITQDKVKKVSKVHSETACYHDNRVTG